MTCAAIVEVLRVTRAEGLPPIWLTSKQSPIPGRFRSCEVASKPRDPRREHAIAIGTRPNWPALGVRKHACSRTPATGHLVTWPDDAPYSIVAVSWKV